VEDGPIERSSVALELGRLERDTREDALDDCLEESLELAREEIGFFPTEDVLLRDDRPSLEEVGLIPISRALG
jgi:hypothetical protein